MYLIQENGDKIGGGARGPKFFNQSLCHLSIQMTIDLQNKLVDTHNTADIATDSESDSEEHVHGENCNHNDVTNRNEKKAREILMKLGLKPVQGIERVTLKRAKNVTIICEVSLLTTLFLDDLCDQ